MLMNSWMSPLVSRTGANTALLPLPRITITRPPTRSASPSIGWISFFSRGAPGAGFSAGAGLVGSYRVRTSPIEIVGRMSFRYGSEPVARRACPFSRRSCMMRSRVFSGCGVGSFAMAAHLIILVVSCSHVPAAHLRCLRFDHRHRVQGPPTRANRGQEGAGRRRARGGLLQESGSRRAALMDRGRLRERARVREAEEGPARDRPVGAVVPHVPVDAT